MDRTLDFPRIWVPEWFRKDKRVHEMRLPTHLPGLGRRQYGITPDMGSSFPAAPVTGMVMWFKSDTGTFQDNTLSTPATANNDPMGGWVDQSGNTHNATQSNGARKGVFLTNRLNGAPSIRLGGSLKSLVTGSFTLNQPVDFYCVIQQTTWVAGCSFFASQGAGNPQLRQYLSGTTPQIAISDTGETCVNGDLSLNTFHVVQFRVNGASSFIKVDNGTNTTGNPGGTAFGGLWIGDVTGSLGVYEFVQILVYSSALSTTDATTNRQYFKGQYSSLPTQA